MAFGIYDTITMLGAFEHIPAAPTFLRDRYFPVDESSFFNTDEVIVEYGNEYRRLAPVVMPRIGGIVVDRDGYKPYRYTPPTIAPKRTLTVDDLMKKQLGEAFYSNKSPAEREGAILQKDLRQMDSMISSTEEYMAAQALQENGYVLKEYADEYGSGKYREYEMHFYDGNNNPQKYIPAKSWADEDSNKLDDLFEMILFLTENGRTASDALITPSIAKELLRDKRILELLDNRRIEIGNIAPKEYANGVKSFGRLNINGTVLELFLCGDTYTDETGNTVPFMKDGTITITSPNCGRTIYGAVTQFESDKKPHTYPAKRVPKVVVNENNDTRDIVVKSKPLLIPKYENAWISGFMI